MEVKIFIVFGALILSCFSLENWKKENDFKYPHFTSWQYVHPDYIPFMMGGEATQPHFYPFQVALDVSKGPDSYYCGGSLISNTWVLTAAHCVDMNPNYIHVTLGAYHLADVSSVMRSIHYVVHEGWDPNTHQNDVALVKLPYNVTFTEFVQPVGLDRGGGDHDENIATTIGQGGTTVLMQIMDVVMSNEECAKASSTYRKLISPKHLCTRGKGYTGTCRGDSGGPLLLDHVQIGIMSFGPRNCSEGMPSVYTRVSEYSEWISEHTLEDGTIKMYNIWLIAIILTAIFCVLFLVLILEKNFLILKKYYTRVNADYA